MYIYKCTKPCTRQVALHRLLHAYRANLAADGDNDDRPWTQLGSACLDSIFQSYEVDDEMKKRVRGTAKLFFENFTVER